MGTTTHDAIDTRREWGATTAVRCTCGYEASDVDDHRAHVEAQRARDVEPCDRADHGHERPTEHVKGSDVAVGDVLTTRWGDRQRVDGIVDTPTEVARVTDHVGRRAALLYSLTYGERIGWRGLPDGLDVTREVPR
jgi:hypothetical protein